MLVVGPRVNGRGRALSMPILAPHGIAFSDIVSFLRAGGGGCDGSLMPTEQRFNAARTSLPDPPRKPRSSLSLTNTLFYLRRALPTRAAVQSSCSRTQD